MPRCSLEIAMLNRTIIAAFLATSAAAFGIAPAAATSQRCQSATAPDRLERPAARPLGTVDSPAPGKERSEPPRTVRA
jgi:hypothetical protein